MKKVDSITIDGVWNSLLLGLLGTSVSLLWLISLLVLISAFRGHFPGTNYASFYIFTICVSTLGFLSHILLEIRFWTKPELHRSITLPGLLLGFILLLTAFRLDLIFTWFCVFCMFEIAALVFSERIADWIGDRLFPLSTRTKTAPLMLQLGPEEEFNEEYFDTEPDENAIQQWTRIETPEGDQLLEGWVRIEFPPDRKTANIHIPFCPPFKSIPKIETLQLDGPETKITIAQLMPFGARIDIKRTIVTSTVPVRIQFLIYTPQSPTI